MALNFDAIDMSKLCITTPQKMKRPGMLQAYVNVGGSKNFVFTTPRMEAQWGIKEWDDGNFTLALPFRNFQDDPVLKSFYEKMQELDEHIIQTALKNSTDWFGKPIPEAYARDKYSPMVKPSTDERWAPKLNLKLYKKDGEWQAKAYGEDCQIARMKTASGEEKTGLDVLEKGDEVVCAIEVAWIFVNASNFGPTLKLKQAMIFKSKTQDFDSGCQIVPSAPRTAQGTQGADDEDVETDED
jgi:hypothetical protein